MRAFFDGWTFARFLVISALSCVFVGYLASSLGKYRSGHVGVTSREEPATASRFPAVMVCSRESDGSELERPEDAEISPWIQNVQQDYMVGGGVGRVKK